VSWEGSTDVAIGGLPADVVLAAAVDGEHWALTELFRAYNPALLRYLRAQAPDAADDLSSDVWVAIARRLRHFAGGEMGFRGWLFTVARSRVIEHRRKEARRRTDPVTHERLDGPAHNGTDADPGDLVVERIAAQEAVNALVADLTSSQADAVLLRVVGGFDVADVARIMGRPAGSVRVLCHRALQRLAARCNQGSPEEVLAG
jgi:RNA polymerase sigma-70 factor, ECF subfamily